MLLSNLRTEARRLKMLRRLRTEAILLVANRGEESPAPLPIKRPSLPLPPLPPQEPRVINQSVNLTVGELVIKADKVSLMVEKLEQEVSIASPTIDLNLSPEINLAPNITVEGSTIEVPQGAAPQVTVSPNITLPKMTPTFKVPPTQVTVEAPQVTVTPPEREKREIRFERDKNGNITKAIEV
jgi:hypothetical protein